MYVIGTVMVPFLLERTPKDARPAIGNWAQSAMRALPMILTIWAAGWAVIAPPTVVLELKRLRVLKHLQYPFYLVEDAKVDHQSFQFSKKTKNHVSGIKFGANIKGLGQVYKNIYQSKCRLQYR